MKLKYILIAVIIVVVIGLVAWQFYRPAKLSIIGSEAGTPIEGSCIRSVNTVECSASFSGAGGNCLSSNYYQDTKCMRFSNEAGLTLQEISSANGSVDVSWSGGSKLGEPYSTSQSASSSGAYVPESVILCTNGGFAITNGNSCATSVSMSVHLQIPSQTTSSSTTSQTSSTSSTSQTTSTSSSTVTASPQDCRTLGCPSGQSCQLAYNYFNVVTSYQCVALQGATTVTTTQPITQIATQTTTQVQYTTQTTTLSQSPTKTDAFTSILNWLSSLNCWIAQLIDNSVICR